MSKEINDFGSGVVVISGDFNFHAEPDAVVPGEPAQPEVHWEEEHYLTVGKLLELLQQFPKDMKVGYECNEFGTWTECTALWKDGVSFEGKEESVLMLGRWCPE